MKPVVFCFVDCDGRSGMHTGMVELIVDNIHHFHLQSSFVLAALIYWQYRLKTL